MEGGAVVQLWWVLYGFSNENREKLMACCKCEEHKWDDPQPVVYTDPADGKDYCLFHAPAEHKGMSVKKFNAQVFERIQVTIDLGDEGALCDLSGTVFSGRISFVDNSFLQISFQDVQFTNNVSFQKSTFEGDAYFLDATFGGVVNFGNSCFKRGSFFHTSKFDKYALFRMVIFKSGVEYTGSIFEGSVDFGEAHIDGDANFNSVRFRGKALFSSAQFGGKASFHFVEFGEGASFRSFTVAPIATLTFADCTISRAAVIFRDCDPTCLNLTGQYDLANFRFIDSPWEKNGRIKACTEDHEDNLQSTRDFYQRMKAKYKTENNEYEASKWHIAEKEAQLKLLWQTVESKPLYLGLCLYKLSSRFGEDPVLAGKWLLGLIGFVLLLLGLGGIGDGQRIIQGPAWPSSWESISNFGTVFMTLFKNVMLFKVVEFKPQYGLIGGVVLVMTRLIIPLQAALFAFARGTTSDANLTNYIEGIGRS